VLAAITGVDASYGGSGDVGLGVPLALETFVAVSCFVESSLLTGTDVSVVVSGMLLGLLSSSVSLLSGI
jgi:hypothetical protein